VIQAVVHDITLEIKWETEALYENTGLFLFVFKNCFKDLPQPVALRYLVRKTSSPTFSEVI